MVKQLFVKEFLEDGTSLFHTIDIADDKYDSLTFRDLKVKLIGKIGKLGLIPNKCNIKCGDKTPDEDDLVKNFSVNQLLLYCGLHGGNRRKSRKSRKSRKYYF